MFFPKYQIGRLNIPFLSAPHQASRLQMTYRFNLHSDLHHELIPHSIAAIACPKGPVPTAPELFLAGDIDFSYRPNYKTFLHDCADQYAKVGGNVYYIAGNHCAYNSNSYMEAIQEMEKVATGKSNLHFLNRTRIQVAPGVVLLGTTLHSFIPPHAEKDVAARMNDFRLIGDHQNRWTVADHNAQHQKDIEWLEREIEKTEEGQKIIVMTHHGPLRSGLSMPEYEVEERSLRYAFQTDLTCHAWFSRIHTFVCGHTHYNVDFVTKEGVRIVSNQRGYGNECDGRKGGNPYCPNLVVQV